MIVSPRPGRTAWSHQIQIPSQGLNSTAWLVGLVQRGNRRKLVSSKADKDCWSNEVIEEPLSLIKDR